MEYPHERMASGAHDRIGVRRRDEAWMDERWADPETRVLVVSGTRVRPRDGAVPWVAPGDAPADGTRVLLGEGRDRTWFALVTGPEAAQAAPEEWLPLRALLPRLAGADQEGVDLSEAPLVFHALGIAEWLWATRFCPRCSEPLTPQAAGHELVCPNGHRHFPRTDPAVIMLVASGEPGSEDERCLLGRQAVWPEGRFSTLAGFCEPGETLEDAVRREVAEETGVAVGEVTYFGNQPWPLPASLMLGFVGRATSTDIAVDDDEIEDARWFTRAEMRAEAEAGTLVLPGGVSISRSLVEHWYGGPLPGQW
ncbi:NAD(+) diphosphatase [Nocardioides anomalus]|uniref:NAD(+) diphosphatase n=1 Tax=Nocardioides anomalus TaxID=2712223 RepID=A0A6G6WFF2_9ACTN|nr:NAD(+) diphosphatase [Nocardioides anomalus]QIG43939.1 NAD(+) diphosphatase [Nocardioides anomalus]